MKLRAPLTFERALVRIADHVGWEAMGSLIGKAPRTVMDYSDPDVTTGISLADAYLLDELYREHGGEGAPIHDCWHDRLELGESGSFATRDLLAERTITVIKEGGEASAALVRAIGPGATPTDRAIAAREVEESIAAQRGTLALLTGPAGGTGDVGQAPLGRGTS